jgi:hypothetical protein
MSTSNTFQYLLRQTDYEGTPKSLQHEQTILEGFGSDGWELAAAVPIVEEGKTVRIVYCLKKHSKGSFI